MNVAELLTLQGWTFHGEGVWTLPRRGKPALRADQCFDGRAPADRRWRLYEDQGDKPGPWRWGEPLRVVGNGELLALVAPVLEAQP